MRSALAVIGLVVLSAALTFSLYLGALKDRVERLEDQGKVPVSFCASLPDRPGVKVCTAEKGP